MSRNIDNIVDASLDPDISVLVTDGAVTGVEHPWVRGHVGVEISFVVAPDCARDGGPGGFEGAGDGGAVEFLCGVCGGGGKEVG